MFYKAQNVVYILIPTAPADLFAFESLVVGTLICQVCIAVLFYELGTNVTDLVRLGLGNLFDLQDLITVPGRDFFHGLGKIEGPSA